MICNNAVVHSMRLARCRRADQICRHFSGRYRLEPGTTRYLRATATPTVTATIRHSAPPLPSQR